VAGFIEKKALKKFSPGEIICLEGDAGNSMFIIKSGQVEVYNTVDRREIRLAKLGPGEIFGEMSLIDGRPRSATVRAITDVECVEITRAMFDKILAGSPNWLGVFMNVLVERLRIADKKQRVTDNIEIGKKAVYLINLMLEKEEKATGIIYKQSWKKLVEDISFLLDVPPSQVSGILSKLIFTPLAESEFNYKDGKTFIVKDWERFLKFTRFCKERYLKNITKGIVEEFEVKSEKEVKFLKFINEILKEQARANDIEMEYMNSKCSEILNEDISKYEKVISELVKSGILKKAVRDDGGKYILVDLELFDIKFQKYVDIELFENILKKFEN